MQVDLKADEDAADPASIQYYHHPLQRDEASGMNATSILMGYGLKGEKIRHTVHEGALRLPKSALEIMDARPNGPAEKYELPGLDSVIRPSRDPTRTTPMTVTEIYGVVLPVDQSNMLPERLQCYARNRRWPAEKRKPEPERIRGGGETDAADDNVSKNTSLQNPANDQLPAEPASAEPNAATSATEDMVVDEPAVSNPSDATVSTVAVQEGTPAAPLPAPASVPSSRPEPSSTAAPAAVSSANPPVAPSSRSLPEVVPLATKPDLQWQQHAPPPNDAMQTDASPHMPDWFKMGEISDLERSLLAEWFDGSAVHRNEKSYVASRNRMIDMSNKLDNRNITTTMIRRSIPGDIGSLMRLYTFLAAYGLINDGALNESAPTPISLQESKAKYRWSEPLQQELLHAVVGESRKRRRLMDSSSSTAFDAVIDWDTVAKSVGHGVTALDCERQFLAMPIAETPAEDKVATGLTVTSSESQQKSTDVDARSILSTRQEFLQDIVDRSNADVVHAIAEAALGTGTAADDDAGEAQKTAIAALATHHAIVEAKARENKVSRVMSEIVDMRMKKLENRLALLDEAEGLLESERAALELERRDLYTARCRHWFGGA